MPRLSSLLSAPLLVLALGTGLTCSFGCDADGEGTSAATAAHATTAVELTVAGMTCGSCAVTIKAALGHLDGIASVEVDTDAGTATVRFDSSQVSAEQIAEKITESGYNARVASTREV